MQRLESTKEQKISEAQNLKDKLSNKQKKREKTETEILLLKKAAEYDTEIESAMKERNSLAEQLLQVEYRRKNLEQLQLQSMISKDSKKLEQIRI